MFFSLLLVEGSHVPGSIDNMRVERFGDGQAFSMNGLQ
jgi:hypothetical protein